MVEAKQWDFKFLFLDQSQVPDFDQLTYLGPCEIDKSCDDSTAESG